MRPRRRWSTAQTSRTDILGLISQTPVVEPDGDLNIRLRVTGAPDRRDDPCRRPRPRADANGLPGVAAGTESAHAGAGQSDHRAGNARRVRHRRRLCGDSRSRRVRRRPTLQRPTVRVGEGVFPVTIALLDGRTTIQQLLTYMVRLPVSHEFGPLGVAVVLPLGGKPALQPDGTVALDEATKDAVVSSSSVLSAHKDVPVTIAPTPETVDALDPSTIEAVRNAVADRSLTLMPYVRLHPNEWVGSGLDAELGKQFDRGTRSLSAALAAPASSVFVADDQLTSEAARFLHARGVSSMVVPDDALSSLDERVFNRTLTQPFVLRDSDGIRAVAADGALAAHAGSTGDPVIDANHLVADLSVLYFDDPPDPRAATFVLPEDRPIDSRFLDALLGALSPSVNRILRPVTLPTLFSNVPVVGSRGDVDSDSDAPDEKSPAQAFRGLEQLRSATRHDERGAFVVHDDGRRAEPAA